MKNIVFIIERSNLKVSQSAMFGLSIILIMFLFVLLGCAPATKPEVQIAVKQEYSEPSREAVYIYEEQQTNEKEIVLRIGSEPKLIKQSYVRLAGVVSGDKPQALVEDAGKGICLSAGDNFKGYKVQAISDDQIILKLERK